MHPTKPQGIVGFCGFALALALIATAACGEKEQQESTAAEPRLPMMTASERKRGEDACEAYIKRVCACAQTDEAFKERCTLGRSRPNALKLLLDVDQSGEDLDDKERARMQAAARKIVQKCIEQNFALDPNVCPR